MEGEVDSTGLQGKPVTVGGQGKCVFLCLLRILSVVRALGGLFRFWVN